ncbi:Cyclic nucleotide-binding protein [Pseudocohnilembus persalinus]|uniref:Cyclic nucleotide-binding protein n=1 Tax=Pseudocohnilembus persalinus TaxID=266149 RepID=A0A0V0R0H2_PSEPJ|nr:Cyclic nucleotide-binding protein [Pseudocohnilembus persalinus]|eukprot:KRX07802.1 Cyclic nucleotide-binding protein [Pseudocohnilembus persalinus]
MDGYQELALTFNIPYKLNKKVEEFFQINYQLNQFWGTGYEEFVQELPQSVEAQIPLVIYQEILKNVPFFQIEVLFSSIILPRSVFWKLNKDNIIYRQGDPSEEIFFILSGEVLIINEDYEILVKIKQGQYFGQEDILNGTKRLFCAICSKNATKLLISKQTEFFSCIENFPLILQELHNTTFQRFEIIEQKLIIDENKNMQLQQQQNNKSMTEQVTNEDSLNQIGENNFDKQQAFENQSIDTQQKENLINITQNYFLQNPNLEISQSQNIKNEKNNIYLENSFIPPLSSSRSYNESSNLLQNSQFQQKIQQQQQLVPQRYQNLQEIQEEDDMEQTESKAFTQKFIQSQQLKKKTGRLSNFTNNNNNNNSNILSGQNQMEKSHRKSQLEIVSNLKQILGQKNETLHNIHSSGINNLYSQQEFNQNLNNNENNNNIDKSTSIQLYKQNSQMNSQKKIYSFNQASPQLSNFDQKNQQNHIDALNIQFTSSQNLASSKIFKKTSSQQQQLSTDENIKLQNQNDFNRTSILNHLNQNPSPQQQKKSLRLLKKSQDDYLSNLQILSRMQMEENENKQNMDFKLQDTDSYNPIKKVGLFKNKQLKLYDPKEQSQISQQNMISSRMSQEKQAMDQSIQHKINSTIGNLSQNKQRKTHHFTSNNEIVDILQQQSLKQQRKSDFISQSNQRGSHIINQQGNAMNQSRQIMMGQINNPNYKQQQQKQQKQQQQKSQLLNDKGNIMSQSKRQSKFVSSTAFESLSQIYNKKQQPVKRNSSEMGLSKIKPKQFQSQNEIYIQQKKQGYVNMRSSKQYSQYSNQNSNESQKISPYSQFRNLSIAQSISPSKIQSYKTITETKNKKLIASSSNITEEDSISINQDDSIILDSGFQNQKQKQENQENRDENKHKNQIISDDMLQNNMETEDKNQSEKNNQNQYLSVKKNQQFQNESQNQNQNQINNKIEHLKEQQHINENQYKQDNIESNDNNKNENNNQNNNYNKNDNNNDKNNEQKSQNEESLNENVIQTRSTQKRQSLTVSFKRMSRKFSKSISPLINLQEVENTQNNSQNSLTSSSSSSSSFYSQQNPNNYSQNSEFNKESGKNGNLLEEGDDKFQKIQNIHGKYMRIKIERIYKNMHEVRKLIHIFKELRGDTLNIQKKLQQKQNDILQFSKKKKDLKKLKSQRQEIQQQQNHYYKKEYQNDFFSKRTQQQEQSINVSQSMFYNDQSSNNILQKSLINQNYQKNIFELPKYNIQQEEISVNDLEESKEKSQYFNNSFSKPAQQDKFSQWNEANSIQQKQIQSQQIQLKQQSNLQQNNQENENSFLPQNENGDKNQQNLQDKQQKAQNFQTPTNQQDNKKKYVHFKNHNQKKSGKKLKRKQISFQI